MIRQPIADRPAVDFTSGSASESGLPPASRPQAEACASILRKCSGSSEGTTLDSMTLLC
jgi:hypothetical protein